MCFSKKKEKKEKEKKRVIHYIFYELCMIFYE